MSSVFAKYNHLAIVAVLLCVLITTARGDIQLGLGNGIQSYPHAFDPFDRMEKKPVLYPQGEIRWMLSDKVSVGCILSRTVVYGVLDPEIDTAQWLTLISGGFYGEFDLTPGSQFFGAGAQVQSIMSTFHVGDLQSYDSGFGVKVYGVAQQELFSCFSVSVRTGVQRAWMRAQAFRVDEDLVLDSFVIDATLLVEL